MSTPDHQSEQRATFSSSPTQLRHDGDAAKHGDRLQKELGEREQRRKSARSSSDSDGPAGGYDDTPVPHAPPGYTLKFTFHRAENLPMADVSSLSSDPYILAQLNTDLPMRHKEDPYLRMRSFTIRKETDPRWDCEWVVAHVPASGFKLKARVYDEDPADHDDLLGTVHMSVPKIDESWEGISNEAYKLRKRRGNKRAYVIRYAAVCLRRAKHLHGRLFISVENLGRTPGDDGGRCYTIGPLWWTKHFSPLLGRIANRKETNDLADQQRGKPKSQRYNFQANQFQLQGPVPPELYHRYVEFRSIIKYGFNKKGISGFLFNKALHHQHSRVYNFDRETQYGVFREPSQDVTLQFLESVRYDKGGRIFTYVLTLDSLLRFTETGPEFSVNMLSKHTMHSDVSIYVAFSGEFFVRRLKYPNRAPPEAGGQNESYPPADVHGGPPTDDPPRDPAYYELIIDNDSGTYRPVAKTLPCLKQFLEHNLPGLQIVTVDCQSEAEKMEKMKDEQRERKKQEGNNIIYRQLSRSSSVSSSDEEALDELEAQGHPRQQKLLDTIKKDASRKGVSKMEHLQGYRGNHEGAGQVAEERRLGHKAPVKAPIAGEER